ncbi:hypothetical protein DL768_006125 [Monosporascus sp. mg162]|nr:hypothetical protein DL768_006125 [Monosporascus sp. mg162]
MRIPADFVLRPWQPTAPTSAAPLVMGVKPISRGPVSIFSRDPADHPVIEPNYLDTEVDRYVWRQRPRSIARGMTGPTTVLGRKVISREAPAGGRLEPLSADAPDELPESRVDVPRLRILRAPWAQSNPELWVKGVQNLRTVDASVFLISIGAHIQAAVCAVAGQMAVIISQPKQD